MKTFLAIVTFVSTSLVSGAARAETDPAVWAYQYVFVMTDDLEQVLPLVQRMRTDDALRQEPLLDYMAEVAITHIAQTRQEDFARRKIVETFGRSDNPRYQTTLRKISMDWVPSQARNSAQKFVRGGPLKIPQYVPGTIDLAAARAAYVAAALGAPKPTDTAAKHLAEFPAGKTIADLFAWAGTPQAVSSRFSHSPVANFDRLAIYYRGVGRVLFTDLGGSDWYSDSVIVDPVAFEDRMPYRLDPAKNGQPDVATLNMIQLLHADPRALRVVLDSIEEKDTASLELMDTAAEMLLSQRSATLDAELADGYAWICVLLRNDGGTRYADVLKTVAASTPVEKLRKHAEVSTSNRNADASPYVPGSMSLDAQRAKYPSPYPERNFSGGAYSGRKP